MNFDELKSKWDNEKSDDVHIPKNMDKLKMSQHPLDKLKRNMRREFFTQVAAVLFIALGPYLFSLQSNLFSIYYILYAMFVVICTYYLYSFYRFYKSMHEYAVSTKDGLLELYYELKLNMERYKSFSFSLLPFAIVFLALYLYNDLSLKGETLNLIIMMICIAFMTAFSMLFTNWWINSFYGKYTKQIRRILDELKEEVD